MNDTNDMRKKYDDWAVSVLSCSRPTSNYGWKVWQAATERATAVERERCAVQAEKATKNNRVIVASIDGVPTSACFIATAIRQGGAA